MGEHKLNKPLMESAFMVTEPYQDIISKSSNFPVY